ncbi:alpha-1,6-mannosyltransferas-like protein subunit [Corynespora cassiicola Philippines]|uniref:Alpha-1,6-mannosyltransferas-like protein subunit n=1 Tax=Corynespora cassiicola Philippines TaxID=1448308 RepID=A0A2T2N6P6_CORCC|nr:alpha-1,6-mannosyltransferas-like protein subunit [Corynespora cassiicola Philippines]
MPPRKTSRPPPYAARNQSSIPIPPALKNMLRRDKARALVLGLLGFLTIVWLLRHMGGGSGSSAAALIGTGAPVVIVTAFDPQANPVWVDKIKKNRDDYAKRHGYLTFYPTTADYPLRNSPASWTKVPALRHAMSLNPGSTWFWYLDSSALIMNPSLDLQSHVLNPSSLQKLMITNEPVVPPDSVIKTFANLKGDRIDLVITQDKDGLMPLSFVVRNGEWAKYFLDAWFDPIYRSYNFQKAETHALEHIVQWHGTILAKLALVPQNMINAYASGPANPKNGQFKEGDLVATFPGCDKEKRNCAEEQQPFFDVLEGKSKGKSKGQD